MDEELRSFEEIVEEQVSPTAHVPPFRGRNADVPAGAAGTSATPAQTSPNDAMNALLRNLRSDIDSNDTKLAGMETQMLTLGELVQHNVAQVGRMEAAVAGLQAAMAQTNTAIANLTRMMEQLQGENTATGPHTSARRDSAQTAGGPGTEPAMQVS